MTVTPLPSLPDTIPAMPLLDGFRETVPDTVIRSEMEQGPAKLRRRTSAGIRRLAMAYLLSAAAVADLDAFYLDTLAGGVMPFSFTHPRNGAALTVRFRKPPEYSATGGGYYKAAIELEIIPAGFIA